MIDQFFENFVEKGFYKGKTEEDIEIYHKECMARLNKVYGKDFSFNTKEDHIKNRDYYLSGIPGKTFTTTGSTGKPFIFSYNKDLFKKIKPYLREKVFTSYGVCPEEVFIIFVGPFRFLEYDLYKKDSFCTIRDRYLKIFLEENKNTLKEKEVVLMSSNSILHKIMHSGLNGDFSLCVSCLEKISDKEILSEYFGCPVSDWIQGSDGSFSAWSCPEGSYHLDFELGDVYNDDQNRIILTDYTNCYEAFINYHNGDYGEITNDNNCKCGIPGKLIKDFFGRETEMFVVGGRIIYGMEIFASLFPGLNFKESVLVQEKEGRIVFYVCGGDKNDIKLAKERLGYLFKDGDFWIRFRDEDFFDDFQVGAKKKKIIREK